MNKFFIAASLLAIAALEAETPPKVPIQGPYPETPGPIVNEADQTDIFAIPLDQDAQSDQMLLYKLQHPKE